jgi:hypothetical protein
VDGSLEAELGDRVQQIFLQLRGALVVARRAPMRLLCESKRLDAHSR